MAGGVFGALEVFKARAAAGSGPVVPPAASVDMTPLHSPLPDLVPAVPLNIDREARPIVAPPVGAPAGASSTVVNVAAPVAPAAAAHTDWLEWAKAHALWLLLALLLLLIVIAASRHKGSGGGYSPRAIGKGRMVKGSPEARAHMASIRSRRKG